MPYLVYYITKDDNYKVLYDNDVIAELEYLPPTTEYSNFHSFKGYDATDDGLKKFKADFIMWCDELLNNDFLSIDYTKYYTHYSAVELTFKRLCKGKYEYMPPIEAIESSWIERTHNGGLTYCDAGERESFGYDFSSFYPNIMSDYNFIIPKSKGVEQFIKTIPTELELGFYRVKITSDDKRVLKVFAFSKYNVYNNISLRHALDLQDEFNLKIDLIIDDKPNAYIYPKGVRGSSIFGTWCFTLYQIKTKYPKNKLIKHLLSSLWGSLSRKNKLFRTYQQIQDENLKVSMDVEEGSDYKIINYTLTDTKEYYELQSLVNPYKHNLRLKSFITAHGRCNIASVAMQNLPGVIRIQTDGIVFNKPIILDHKAIMQLPYKEQFLKYLVPDAKTTGFIKWENVNRYSDLF